ncbi:hypothetical protein ABT160_18950 [Streptomyces sp. NPDC001941]|uniref:helix-turn-helix domain-containing protein n=1 Tax=Streptomyces sp. NPDC001941 TaxID=3154659 RepID=UPI00332F3888
MTAVTYQKILQSRRSVLSREDVGLPARKNVARRRGPKVSGLTQRDVDLALNERGGLGYYHMVENGKVRPSSEYLHALARLLCLTPEEYMFVHAWVHGHPPVLPLDTEKASTLAEGWQRVLDGQQQMAYVTDSAFNVELYNARFAAMFPGGRPPANSMEWMLLSDQARDEILTDWDVQWGPRVLPEFWAALESHPEDPDLQRIHARVLRDARLMRLYDRKVCLVHPDGHRRPLHHALEGRGFATMYAAAPLSSPSSRLMIVEYSKT